MPELKKLIEEAIKNPPDLILIGETEPDFINEIFKAMQAGYDRQWFESHKVVMMKMPADEVAAVKQEAKTKGLTVTDYLINISLAGFKNTLELTEGQIMEQLGDILSGKGHPANLYTSPENIASLKEWLEAIK